MPIYEYECDKCGKVLEAYQKFSEKPLKKCEHCSGKLNKLISHSTFHLKGTGWYVTDYGKGTGVSGTSTDKKAKKSEKSSAKNSDSKSDS